MITYTLKNITHNKFDLDDEIIFYQFDIEITAPKYFNITYTYPLRLLLKFIEEKYNAFYTYWEATRKGLDLWGNTEASTFEAIGSAAEAELEQYLIECIEYTGIVSTLYEANKNNLPLTEEQEEIDQRNINTLFESFEDVTSGMLEYNRRYRKFCKLLDKTIHDTAFDMYPELAELEPAQMLQVKHLFVEEIIAIHTKIEHLLKE
jgi:hypothetical protein